MDDESIHPRVVNGRTRFEKVNTCILPTESKRVRLIDALSQRVDEHPNDTMAAARLERLERGKR